jgi:hypothetical protein
LEPTVGASRAQQDQEKQELEMLCRIVVVAAAVWASTTTAHATLEASAPTAHGLNKASGSGTLDSEAKQSAGFVDRTAPLTQTAMVTAPAAGPSANPASFSNVLPAQSTSGSDTLPRVDYYKLERSTADDAGLFDGETVRRILHFSDLSPSPVGQGQVSVFTGGPSEYFDRIQFASRGNACHIDEHAGPLVLPEPGMLGLLAAGLLFVGAVARRRMRH